MIQVTYNEVNDTMILRAEGHAGYAPKGQDIVCAAVSVLMQTLAYSVDADNTGNTFELPDGKNGNRLTVQAPMSVLNRDKFDFVVEGLSRLAENYPENVQFKKLCTQSVNVMDLQMFAEGGDGNGSSGDSGSGIALSGASRQLPQSGSPWQDGEAKLDEKGHAGQKSEADAGSRNPEEDGEDKGGGEAGEETKKLSPAERRKAFGQMMSGEYKDLADEMMQNAVQIAAQNLEASPEMRGLLGAIAEKYGTDATDLAALTDAIRNGVVKDDAYFEKVAMEKGISVKTAREMDKLETQNKRLTAQQQAAQQMQKAAAERARIAQIQAQWDAEADALKAKYPDFDRGEVLANPEVEKMMRAGCSMEAAYRAAYFDRLMARQTAATAQQTEQGVLNRVQQRASRPAENGTRPGGAVQTHLDVEHMSRKDREALEKRVLRGEIITL